MLDLNTQNVPQSYLDFMANIQKNQMTDIRYGCKKTAQKSGTPKQDYVIYAYDMLIKNNPYDDKSPPNYQMMSYLDLNYKALEGDIDNINLEQIKQAFCFGSLDSGKLIFHPKTHAIYEVYLDLYVRQIADSFDEMLEQGVIDDTWEI